MSFFEDDVPEIKQEGSTQPSVFADDVITLGAPAQEQPQQQPIVMQPTQNSFLEQEEEDDGSISVSMTSSDSPLGKWEHEHQAFLEQRMKESNEKLQQTLTEAKKEIEELRKQRNEHCKAREKQNEEQESILIHTLHRSEDNDWKRGSELIDFQKQYTETDNSRMKALMIDMKQKK